MSETPKRPEAQDRQPIETRKPWVVPQVQTLRAGDAELNQNPINPDGPLTATSS